LLGSLFGFLRRFRRARAAPGIILLLGLGDPLKRGLVSLLVDLGLLLFLLLLRVRPLGLRERLRRQRHQGTDRHYRRENPDRTHLLSPCSPAAPANKYPGAPRLDTAFSNS